MTNKVDTQTVTLRVPRDDVQRGKDAALDQRYMNLSQFIRDAVEEKIESWKELQD